MITFDDVTQNKSIQAYIRRSGEFLETQEYTDHGIDHAQFVAGRCRELAEITSQRAEDISHAQSAGFCHDMGNFLSRTNHHYLGAALFGSIFQQHDDQYGVTIIMEAIANHDKEEAKLASPVSAIVILADKSDVRRSRVTAESEDAIRDDIHNRVNYSVTQSHLDVKLDEKTITLGLELDETITPIMDYFEIFTDRMHYCRVAAEYLGYTFKLAINSKELL